MSEPSLFPELSAESRAADRLFFALFPDGPAAARIAAQARALRSQHGLGGKPLLTDRFHVTLVHIGDFHGLQEGIVREALAAAGKVSAALFDVRFDSAISFSNKPGNHPLVLLAGADADPLMRFQRALCIELIKAGVRYKGGGAFTPHITLLYDALAVEQQPIDPIVWRASEFVLVHSRVGKTQHIPLGRWALT